VALAELVSIMKQGPTFMDKFAQQAMRKVFGLPGDGHLLNSQFRENLQRYTH